MTRPALAAFSFALVAVMLGGTASRARAELFRLEGRFQCLDDPQAHCGDSTPLTGPNAAKPKKIIAAAPMPVESADLTPPAMTEKPIVYDPLVEIAQRVKARHVTAEDMARLRNLAKAGKGRAIELLAWCDYTGLGVQRDAAKAYILYGVAAAAGVPHARDNQAVIYEYGLTPDQQQLVLDVHNSDIASDDTASSSD